MLEYKSPPVVAAGRFPLADMQGKRIGKLLVISYLGRTKYRGQAVWQCRCDCGKIKNYRADRLREKRPGKRLKSCGCSSNFKGAANGRFKGYGGVYGTYWKHVKYNAKIRGIPMRMTVKDAWEIFVKQDGLCALTGLPMTLSKGFKGGGTASLDRIDSRKAYTPDNVQWVLTVVNRAKMNMKDADFVAMCRDVVAFADKKEEKIVHKEFDPDEFWATPPT